MKNRIVVSVLFTLVLAVLVACGGGGGGPSTTGGIVGPVSSIRLEAVVNGVGTTVDPSNIFVNEQIQFRVTGIDEGALGQPRVVLPASAFSLTGNPGGTINATGLFTASASPTGFFGTIQIVYDSLSYTAGVRVVTPQAIIHGVGRTTTGFPARGVEIQALNASGTQVANGFVASDGTIRMSVPLTAVRFTVSFGAVDPGPNFFYARQFAYASKDFSTTIADCTAPLPALTFGATSNLATDVVFYPNSNPSPPPPPDGCTL